MGVTGKLTVNGIDDLPEETLFPVVITVQNATLRDYGTIYCPTLWVFNWTTYGGAAPVTSTDLDLNFWISNITGDVTITFTVNGEDTDLVLPYVELTSLEARMAQDDTKPTVDAANYDQDVFFKAIFNPAVLPTGITFDDVNWFYPLAPSAGTPWAKLTAAGPGHPTVEAQLGATLVSADVWKVKVTLKEITLGADAGFREIRPDPGESGDYSVPHWDSARAQKTHPILVQVGRKLKATPKFTIEPADWTGGYVTCRATGGYDMGEHSSPASGPEFQGSEMTATTAVDTQVGHEKPTLNWEYRILGSAYSSIGSSDLDIYRSLHSTETDAITFVHLACHDVSGATQAAALAGIWAKFKGRTVCNYAGGVMTYWASTAADGSATGLIRLRDGTCGAWVYLFQRVLQMHGINSTEIEMELPAKYSKVIYRWIGGSFDVKKIDYAPDGLWFKARAGQGGTGTTIATYPADPFLNHVGVEIDGKMYDPSYGLGPLSPTAGVSSYIRWEDALLDSLRADQTKPWLPPGIRSRRLPNRFGMKDTGAGTITAPIFVF